jgi:hypothetical protein
MQICAFILELGALANSNIVVLDPSKIITLQPLIP